MLLIGLALAFARPQLEGWGILEVFRIAGVAGAFEQFLRGAPTRMLEPVPLAIAWVLGHGAIWALAFVYGVELAAKYAVARWAVSPLISGAGRWVIGTLAAVMLPWAGQWRGHNMAQQLAAALMLVAVGGSLRLRKRFHLAWFGLTSAAVVLSLLTYEALILCALVIPLIVLSCGGEPGRSSIRSAARSGLPIISGVIVYGLIYWTQIVMSGKNYHSTLLSGPQPWKTPLTLFTRLYETTYVDSPWTLALLVALMACLVGSAILALPDSRERLASAVVITVAVLLLPLLSLPYAVNFYFLSDIERVGFPLGFGFFLLCVAALSKFSRPDCCSLSKSIPAEIVIVAVLLTSAAANAYNSFRPYRLQRLVLDQTKALVRENNAQLVLLRDWTGTLGDMYTFAVASTLQEAMSVEGLPIEIALCTPTNIDRLHPMMWKVHGTTGVPRCEALPPAARPQLLLDLRPQTADPRGPPLVTSSGMIPVTPEGRFATSVIEGAIGREGGELWWINAPQAIIALENRTTESLEADLSGTLIPPPCFGKIEVTVTVDGKSVTYSLAASVNSSAHFSFTTSVPGGGKKFAHLDVDGSPCNPKQDPRTFYAGIVKLTAR